MNHETGQSGPVSPIDLVGEADFVLGASRISPSRLEVSRAGLHETLEPRIMQVLVALYQADGRVVSRDELIARCWEGRIVGEDAITRAVGRLRRLSEADDGASFHIETVPKIGFRLVVAANGPSPVTPPGPAPFEDQSPGKQGVTEWLSQGLLHKVMIVAAAAMVAVAALLWRYSEPATVIASSQQLSRPTGPSVAVLPFLNLSGDPKEDYFSDGTTEEITSALTKISNLRVVGRTSAFQFKGKNGDLSVIGQTLHATYLVEGSVRKAGEHVRIQAQLIKATTGDNVWSESYDRNLTDIFTVQEDVAKAIAAALRAPLGLNQGEVLASNRQIDPASYEDYLRAAALVRKRDTSIPLDTAIALLEGVVSREPNYAPAWALLAGAYVSAVSYDPTFQRGSVEWLRRSASEALPKAEAAVRRAIELDARNADAYAALGIVQGARGKWFDSEQSLKQALNLDPLNPHVLSTYSAFLAITGQIKPAIAMREKLTELDPLVPPYNNFTARLLLTVGDTAKALTIAQTMPIGSAERASVLMRIYAARKQYKEAATSIHSYPAGRVPPGNVALAERLLRTAPSPAPHQEFPYMGGLGIVYLYVGIPERALEVMEYHTDAGYISFAALAEFWERDFGSARKTERFKNLIRKLGLVDYWRARGWPQYCHPVGIDDFACN